MHPKLASFSAAGNSQIVLGLALQLTVTGEVMHHKGSAICNNAPAVNYSTRHSSFRWSRPDETSCRPSGGDVPKWMLATESQVRCGCSTTHQAYWLACFRSCRLAYRCPGATSGTMKSSAGRVRRSQGRSCLDLHI